MKTILEYNKRFYQLIGSTIGDVKPLISEDNPERNGGKNGELPSSELITIGQGNNFLHIESWPYFKKMKEEAKKDGIEIKLYGSSGSGYRLIGSPEKGCSDGFTQWCAWQRYGKGRAAYPGTSNHGWGMAIDVEGVDAKKWVKKNGPKYGWVWGEAPNEDWHFTFCKSNRYLYHNCDTLLKDSNYTEDMIEEVDFYDDAIIAYKNSWNEIIEKKINKTFNIESNSRPDLIKVKPFTDFTYVDYHTFWEYANITFLGEKNVELSLLGEKNENQDKPSSFYYLLRMTDKSGNNISGVDSEKIANYSVNDVDVNFVEHDSKDAASKFIELCRKDKEWPYPKEGPKEFENENPFGI